MSTAVASRKFTFIKTVGKNKHTVESEAPNWGILQQELPTNFVKGMKAVIAVMNVTLESPEAVLPLEDCVIFLFAQKVDSGCGNESQEEGEENEDNVVGTEQAFDYEQDNVDEYNFINSDEEMKVRLNLIIKGSENVSVHSQRMLTLLNGENRTGGSKTDDAEDPDKALFEEAERIANTFAH